MLQITVNPLGVSVLSDISVYFSPVHVCILTLLKEQISNSNAVTLTTVEEFTSFLHNRGSVRV